MISVFFYCSSPYVGYRIKKADYVNGEMVACSRSNKMELGEKGFSLFTASGSFMFLGNVEGKRYFHARQSKTENFDENNRRIYNDIAFVSDNAADFAVINKIAAYAFFEEEKFSSTIASMITLLEDGFTVSFDSLSEFMSRFNENPQFKTEDIRAKRIFDDIFMKNNSNEICLIVPETTMEYFLKQVNCGLKNNPLKKVTLEEQDEMAAASSVTLPAPVKGPADVADEGGNNDIEDNDIGNNDSENEKITKEIAALKKENEENKNMISGLNETIKELKSTVSTLNEKLNGFSVPNDRTLIRNILIAAAGVVASVLLSLFISRLGG